ncbi:DUF6470 family protein [Rossellomorea sp. GCM10028870]|uniref:DUF6470 family protein n=1 Tax=Rossellomorea sp. GCM10028870 TaxID=3273426 RepID=UPI00361D8880
MNIPQIRLQSTPAELGIQTTPGRMDIEQPKAELDIQQPAGKMEIERRPSRLTIDQTEARADMDLKSVRRRIEEYSRQGYEDWLAGLARVAQDGDELMMVEHGGNAIADQAKRNSESPMYDFNIGWIPSAGSVKIGYDPGSVRVNFEPQKVINNSRPQKPTIHYTPAQVDISLKRYADLQIDFANLKHVGINYEQEI